MDFGKFKSGIPVFDENQERLDLIAMKIKSERWSGIINLMVNFSTNAKSFAEDLNLDERMIWTKILK